MMKAQKNRPTIRLWQSGGIGLIIPFESGVVYSNQTGGYGCLHPEVQGVYIPLVNERDALPRARIVRSRETRPSI